MVKDEEGEPWTDPPEPFADGAKSTLDHEREVLEATGIDGLVLRYGQFYGPGHLLRVGRKHRRAGASTPLSDRRPGRRARSRSSTSRTPPRPRWPPSTAGRRASTTSSTTSRRRERDWLPVYAEALGAKPPRRVPTWLARIVAGRFAVIMATELRGASNAKAKRELGWEPRIRRAGAGLSRGARIG